MSKRRRNSASRAERREKVRDIFVARPFEGLASEADWVALRELVPAATASLQLSAEYAAKYPDRQVVLATVLPMAWPAMVRGDGTVLVGLQRQFQSGDVSRDIAASLLSALDTEVGQTVGVPALPGPGPRLQDVLADGPLDVTIETGFDFWIAPGADEDPNVKASLDQANESIYPTEQLAAAPGAYWCQVPDKAHVRWVLAEDEDPALDALAKLAAAGELTLGDGTRFAGMFRAHGLLVPVWDVPIDRPASDWETPLGTVRDGYQRYLAAAEPLTAEERRSRQGLLGRQFTLR
ncbi:preprotein translocase SecA [Actinocatenispora thailandica]|uniref:Preprotein translocase SecA n=1 Tax=Actinocatenispora thailandica TaxID=227318 RepID=A0A7R7DW25_9ACTN|nr:DUF5926 family protein [Actinocatenispora thailandica]BCJ38741.1 preprotein translocase SecA [Actinocatenispora thailandica]